MNKDNTHSFIQVILTDIKNKIIKTEYIRFPYSEFTYTDKPFSISIGHNVFTKTYIKIDIDVKKINLNASINFGQLTDIKRTIFMPNIMGYFGYIFFMECYHGVVSMDHACMGKLDINKKIIDFDNGRGYIEKDWGRSFPKSYIWVQCNHFQQANTSIMLSLARIPFLGTSFEGFICNLVIYDKEYRFATYNGAKIIKKEIGGQHLNIKIKRKDLILEIEAQIQDEAELIAPENGSMSKTIKEGLSGIVSIKLMTKDSKIIYEDEGNNAGIEIVR